MLKYVEFNSSATLILRYNTSNNTLINYSKGFNTISEKPMNIYVEAYKSKFEKITIDESLI